MIWKGRKKEEENLDNEATLEPHAGFNTENYLTPSDLRRKDLDFFVRGTPPKGTEVRNSFAQSTDRKLSKILYGTLLRSK